MLNINGATGNGIRDGSDTDGTNFDIRAIHDQPNLVKLIALSDCFNGAPP